MDKSLEIALERFCVQHFRENVITHQGEFISGKYSYCTNKFHLTYPNNEKTFPFIAHHVASMIKNQPNTSSILRNERKLSGCSSLVTIASLFLIPKFKKTSIAVGLTSIGLNYLSQSIVISYNQFFGMVSAIKKLIEFNDYESLAWGSLYVPKMQFKTALLISGNLIKHQYEDADGKIKITFSPLTQPLQKIVVSVELD